MLHEKQLETYTRNFLKQNYNLELTVPVRINNRLSRALGRFSYNQRSRMPVAIEFSKHLIATQDVDMILDVARHEAIHYALFVQGKPHKDGEPLFESELVKHNSKSTRSFNVIESMNSNYHLYLCNCTEHKTLRALSHQGKYHSCRKCKSNLVYKGKVQ